MRVRQAAVAKAGSSSYTHSTTLRINQCQTYLKEGGDHVAEGVGVRLQQPLAHLVVLLVLFWEVWGWIRVSASCRPDGCCGMEGGGLNGGVCGGDG